MIGCYFKFNVTISNSDSVLKRCFLLCLTEFERKSIPFLSSILQTENQKNIYILNNFVFYKIVFLYFFHNFYLHLIRMILYTF